MTESSEYQDKQVHEVLERIEAIAKVLEASAVARDKSGGHAEAERALIRQSGLLHLTTPVCYGGQGVSWHILFLAVRRLAQADSALAHIFAFHHLQIATILLFGQASQHERLLPDTVKHNWFWGNALNPNDRRTEVIALEAGQAATIHGPKAYCSGSVGADWLSFSAWDAISKSLLIGVLPVQTTGVGIVADWDAFGQKQTDSGTVSFDHVRVASDHVLVWPAQPSTPRATLRSQLAQLTLVNLYIGIGQGALQAGLDFTRKRSRPFVLSEVERLVDDPYVQKRFGLLSTQLKAAQVLADLAAQKLDLALSRGIHLTANERGEIAIAVAQAKVMADHAVLQTTQEIFESTGPGATSERLGLDRYWRNARVHTLHDPLDYKLRDLGRFALLGKYPEPGSYS
jgi:alkylation response protein AidB-like acyl-CoA dehydrogenase